MWVPSGSKSEAQDYSMGLGLGLVYNYKLISAITSWC